MALIQSWESSESFDNELSKIRHYIVHPEMKPFIGTHYNESGILLVGESHFYEYNCSNNQEAEKKYIEESWYIEPTPNVFSYKNNFNTRGVIHNYLTRKRTKAHSMFRNPAQCIIDVYGLKCVSDSEAFNVFAFMNYFQKPALVAHKSIDSNGEDAQIAFDTFVSVCKVIRPKRVIFLSKKAYECYTTFSKENTLSGSVDFVYHPTCPYWNNYGGKEKFEKLISQNKEPVSFSKYRHYSSDEIMRVVPNSFILKGPKQNRFIKDITTIRLYENPDGVYELAIHFYAGESKVGIGYNIENQGIWVWNYDKAEYISISDINKYKGLNEHYSAFCNVVEKL